MNGLSSSEQARPRRAGRQLDPSRAAAIMAAALEGLAEVGYDRLSMDDIAARAHAGKGALYRRWPSKAALVVDAVAAWRQRFAPLTIPDTGSLRDDMARQMRRVIRLFRSPRGKVVAALLAGGQSDPELIEAFRERFLWPKRRQAYKTLQRGIDRGELPADSNLDLLLDSLYGPIYMRFLIRHAELTETFADQVCGVVLNHCPNPATKSR